MVYSQFELIENMPKAVDVKRILLTLNAFSVKLPLTSDGSSVRFYIFDLMSRFNHSCQANIEQNLDDENIT